MPLSNQQKLQVEKQLKGHRHGKYSVDIKLTDEFVLNNFIVYPDVLRPEKMVSLFLARFLFFNNGTYLNKKCLDVGCGSGLQGIVMSLFGAKEVFFSDISENAIENTRENIQNLTTGKKVEVLRSDLFDSLDQRFDVIVFNHPFFPGKPRENIEVSKAMLDEGGLISRFLEDAKKSLKVGGRIIMPYFDMAGKTNDPKIRGKEYGHIVKTRFSMNIPMSLQNGRFFIYELRPKR